MTGFQVSEKNTEPRKGSAANWNKANMVYKSKQLIIYMEQTIKSIPVGAENFPFWFALERREYGEIGFRLEILCAPTKIGFWKQIP